MLVSVKGCPRLPPPDLLPQGRDRNANLGPVTKGSWCPFECLLRASLLHVRLEGERLHSTNESTEVPGRDVTSGCRTNETAERGQPSVLALVPYAFPLCPCVTLSSLEHPRARPFASHHCNPVRNFPETQRVRVP